MKDELLESLNEKIVKICPRCDSKNVSVRVAKNGWYFVGCLDCSNKRMSDKKMLPDAVEIWNKLAKFYLRKGANN